MAIFRREPPNRGAECSWRRQKSRFWADIWLYCVLLTLRPARCYQHDAAGPRSRKTALIAGSKRRSLLMVGDVLGHPVRWDGWHDAGHSCCCCWRLFHTAGLQWQQKAQLSQRDRAMFRVIEYVTKSLKVIQNCTNWKLGYGFLFAFLWPCFVSFPR